jgi:hypothetical protein
MQVAPSLVTGLFLLALPLLPIVLIRSTHLVAWWLSRVTVPAFGQATVYGISVTGAAALSKGALTKLRMQATERPDLSEGVPGNVSEDKQERFWKDAEFDVDRARKALTSDAAWRKKMSVDSIMEARPISDCPIVAAPHTVVSAGEQPPSA